MKDADLLQVFLTGSIAMSLANYPTIGLWLAVIGLVLTAGVVHVTIRETARYKAELRTALEDAFRDGRVSGVFVEKPTEGESQKTDANKTN